MSPTSYQAAPPRGRGANLIEAASPRQEVSLRPGTDSKPARSASEETFGNRRGGNDPCGLHECRMLRVEILGPSNEVGPTFPGDRVDFLDGGLGGSGRRRVGQGARLDLVDRLGLQRRIFVNLHGTSLERNAKGTVQDRCRRGVYV